MRTCEPVHRHQNGVCDLPADPAEDLRPGPRKHSSCYWTESTEMYYGRDHGCGCAMCTMRFERQAERRRERREGRREARAAQAAFRNGHIDER